MISHLTPYFIWWPLPDLNWGPIDYESTALTTELRGQDINIFSKVGDYNRVNFIFLV